MPKLHTSGLWFSLLVTHDPMAKLETLSIVWGLPGFAWWTQNTKLHQIALQKTDEKDEKDIAL